MASWWERHGVPRLIKCACSQGQIMKVRSKIVPNASGDVLGEDAKGAHSLFHHSDVCAHAVILPDFPAPGPLIPGQAYTPIAAVLALAQRSTHPLRPPIA